MKCSVIGIDLAKNIFQICALDQHRKVISNKKVKRANLLAELRQYEPTLVVMEACYKEGIRQPLLLGFIKLETELNIVSKKAIRLLE